MVILLKIKRKDFFQQDSVPILVSRTVKTRSSNCCIFEIKTCYGTGKLYKDLFFVYLQPSVNKNVQNLAILTLQFDGVTVKTIYYDKKGSELAYCLQVMWILCIKPASVLLYLCARRLIS